VVDYQAAMPLFTKRGMAAGFHLKRPGCSVRPGPGEGRTHETQISAAGLMISKAKPIVRWGRKATGFFVCGDIFFIKTAELPGLTSKSQKYGAARLFFGL
jgi:hypothetical protein